MLYSEWLRKVAGIVKDAEENYSGELYLCHVLGERPLRYRTTQVSYHNGTLRVRDAMLAWGLFNYPGHIASLSKQIQGALDTQTAMIALGTLPMPHTDTGIGPWLEHVGRTRSDWLEHLATQASPSAKAYKPTHGGYPDASRNISSHRCSRDDGVSGD